MDRFERLFSRRKSLAPSPIAPTEDQRPPSPPEQEIPYFPSPSFIRPKCTPMAARDEPILRRSNSRCTSYADIFDLDRASSFRASSFRTQASGDYNRKSERSIPPTRSVSFVDQSCHEISIDRESFHILKPPVRKCPPVPSRRSRQSGLTPINTQSANLRTSLSLRLPHGPAGPITPPLSDHEEETRVFMKKKLPPLPSRALPTPDHSPKINPHAGDPQYARRSQKGNDGLPVMGLAPSLLRRPESDWSLVSSAPEKSITDSILREPHVQDFLDMTDDDIADDTFDVPQSNPVSSSRVIQLSSMYVPAAASKCQPCPLLTLSPPRGSQVTTAGAFGTSRIATRYDFDLIYIVNLWPGRPASSRAGDSTLSSAQKPMAGRLLAAFGLENLCSPLQINTAVHTSILRSQKWIEYCNSNADKDDLARGYACAFHPGQFSSAERLSSTAQVSGIRLSEKIDRGIVFAAYRRPRAGRNKLGRDMKSRELGQLRREAEALVEMLIDIDAMSRLRTSSNRNRHSDSTGPLPGPRLWIVSD